MSHFYASIPTSARKTVATARGHKSTGLEVRAASWAGAVTVTLRHCEATGRDTFEVWQQPHHGQGVHVLVAEGIVGQEDAA